MRFLIAGLMTLFMAACAHQPTNDENQAAKSQRADANQAFAEDCRSPRNAERADCQNRQRSEEQQQGPVRSTLEREQERLRELDNEIGLPSTTPIPRQILGRDLPL